MPLTVSNHPPSGRATAAEMGGAITAGVTSDMTADRRGAASKPPGEAWSAKGSTAGRRDSIGSSLRGSGGGPRTTGRGAPGSDLHGGTDTADGVGLGAVPDR